MNAFPVDITIRDLPESAAIESRIRQKISKLPQYCDRVEFCKVVVGYVQKRQVQGKLFDTHIEVGVPGKRLAVTHQKGMDLYVAIRDAFAAMNRQLQRYSAKTHGNIKKHVPMLFGHVTRKFEDYGFIEVDDGIEYYFHASNVLHSAFGKLEVGEFVTFLDNGMVGDSFQATHVCVKESIAA